jgi:hypothetical protein
MGFTSKSANEFDNFSNCLPEEWFTPDSSQPLPEEYATPDSYSDPGVKSTFTEILDGVQTVVEFICEYSGYLTSLLSSIFRRRMRRHKYRMFVETRVVRYSKARGFWSTIVDTITEFFGAAKAWVSKTWEDVKKFGELIMTNLKIFWDQLLTKIKAFLNNDFITQVQTIVNCLMGAFDVVKVIKDMVYAIIDRVTQVARTIMTGNFFSLAEIFIELICRMGEFREAYNTLAEGLEERNQMKKFELYGRFIGKSIKILEPQTKRRRIRKH